MGHSETSAEAETAAAPGRIAGARRRRSLLIAALSAILGVSGWLLWPSSPASVLPELRGRSVLVILIDTLRADFLGAYGFAGDISPNLDAFVDESILFERCVAPAPWTVPAIASLFLSQYPDTHRIVKKGNLFRDKHSQAYQTAVVPARATTLAEAFAASGYATAAFVANAWLQPDHGFAQGFGQYVLDGDDRIWPAAVARMQTSDQPFFVYLHSFIVHGPYQAAAADVDALRAAPGVGAPRPLTDAQMQQIPGYLRKPDWARRSNARDVREWRLRYGAQVRTIDRAFGRLIRELRASGVLERTIVVLTSDHGEELGEHGGWDHGHNLHRHQLHVPLVIRLPEAERQGRFSGVVNLVDLYPTLAAAAGVAVSDSLEGRNLLPAIASSRAPPERAVFASGVKRNTRMRALIDRQYKLIVDDEAGTIRLFDTSADPGELDDLSSQLPELVTDRLARLRAHEIESARRGPGQPEFVDVPDELRKQLESLGYVE